MGERHDMSMLEYALSWSRLEVENFRKEMKIAVLWSCAAADGVTEFSMLRWVWDANPCF